MQKKLLRSLPLFALAVSLASFGCSTQHGFKEGWEKGLADKTAAIRKTTRDETERICNYRFKLGAVSPFVFIGACVAWNGKDDESPDIEIIIADWSFLKHELYQAAIDWINVGHRDPLELEWPEPDTTINLIAEATPEGVARLAEELSDYELQNFIINFVLETTNQVQSGNGN